MTWWGKLIGTVVGLATGGPIGFVLGSAFGHGFDTSVEALSRKDTAYQAQVARGVSYACTFSVMGFVAKSDGRVTEAAIATAEKIFTEMKLSPQGRARAIALFRDGKKPSFNPAPLLEQLQSGCRGSPELLLDLLRIQLRVAYADGPLSPARKGVLRLIRQHLGLSVIAFGELERAVRKEMMNGPPHHHIAPPGSLAQAYALLGLSPTATDNAVKLAYRRLL
ncbi:MAG: co-chaperone DjlA, partial [Gammaproteobacteria bacterium]